MSDDIVTIWVKGRRVQGRRHPNGGGFVALTAIVTETVYVGPKAKVLDRAKVWGEVRMDDQAVVRGDAQVSGSVHLGGKTKVSDTTVISA